MRAIKIIQMELTQYCMIYSRKWEIQDGGRKIGSIIIAISIHVSNEIYLFIYLN